jgi:hypothetical protein
MLALLPLLLLSACGPGDETGMAVAVEPALADISWALHEEIGSMPRVSWRQEREGVSWVEYRVDADRWERTPARARAAGEHEQLVLGVPYDHKLLLRVVFEDPEGVERSPVLAARTDRPPSAVLEPVLLHADPEAWEPSGRWLLGSMNTTMPGWQSGVFFTFVLDRRGRLVWARETEDQHFTMQVRVAGEGTSLLVDDNTWWSLWDFSEPCQLHRVTLDGALHQSMEIPGANHPWTELPDGRIAWWAMPGDGEGQLRILRDDGDWELVWSCTPFMKQLGTLESCLANTVSYRAQDDSFLVSLALQHLVVQLDAGTGEVLNLFGQHEQAWGFDPPESGFWLQHGVAFTEAGTPASRTRPAWSASTSWTKAPSCCARCGATAKLRAWRRPWAERPSGCPGATPCTTTGPPPGSRRSPPRGSWSGTSPGSTIACWATPAGWRISTRCWGRDQRCLCSGSGWGTPAGKASSSQVTKRRGAPPREGSRATPMAAWVQCSQSRLRRCPGEDQTSSRASCGVKAAARFS